MYTGYSDPSLTRIYASEFGQDHITFNRTFFTGYEVVSEHANPYKEPVRLKGTDAVQNLPMSTT